MLNHLFHTFQFLWYSECFCNLKYWWTGTQNLSCYDFSYMVWVFQCFVWMINLYWPKYQAEVVAQLEIFLYFCLNVAKYCVVLEKCFHFNCILNHLWWYTNTNSSCRNWPATLGPVQKLFTMGWNWASLYYVRIQLAEEKAIGVISVNLSHSCSVIHQ